MKKLKYLISLMYLTAIMVMPAQVLAANSSSAGSDCTDKSDAGVQKCLENNQIVKDLNTVITLMSGVVGIVIVGSLIFAGIRYSLAGDNSSEVSAAKQRIINSFIALLAYIAIFSLLQWIIPGGVF